MAANRVDAIDALRGFAALAVVLFHFFGFIPLLELPAGPFVESLVTVTRYGHLGVPVFFILSGYVIAMTSSRYVFTPATAGRFLLRRMVRIAPPYWAMVLIIAFTILIGRTVGVIQNTLVTLPQVAAHFAYLQEILKQPTLDVAYWTLCLEVQFYGVFALVAVALHRANGVLRTVVVALTCLGSLAIEAGDLVPQQWCPRLWYQFASGVLVFDAARGPWHRTVAIAVLSIVTGWGLTHAELEKIVLGLSAVFLALSPRIRYVPRIFLKLGLISYSLYIVHGLVGLLLGVILRRGAFASATPAAMIIAIFVAGAIVFAAVFYLVFERPAIRWSKRVRVGPPAIPSVAGSNSDSPTNVAIS